MDKHRVIIIGAGIKGASEAFMLAQNPGFEITIVDPAPGTGTTGKSDGRVHSGGTGLAYDEPDILRRKLVGGTTLAALFPGTLQTVQPACYGFTCDNEDIVDRLVAHGALEGVAIRRFEPHARIRRWFAPGVCWFYALQEFAFDPAGITAGFLRCAIAKGAKLLRRRALEALRLPSSAWRVRLDDGGAIDGDLVISALGTGIRSLPVEGSLRLPEGVSVVSWPIATVAADAAPPLDRVLVTADRRVQMASVIKHGHILTVDAKPVELPEIDGPWDLPSPNPRPYDPSVYAERHMIDVLRHRYRPFASLPDDAFRIVYCSHIRTKPEPRRPHRTPSDIIIINEVLPRFIQHVGGMATTSLLDAADVTAAVHRSLGLPPVDTETALADLGRQGFPCSKVRGLDLKMQYA